eukprot:6211780-Pleurochrysis_carterae.AAC.6
MKKLSAVTVGSGIPRTSREWIMADMVALVRVDVRWLWPRECGGALFRFHCMRASKNGARRCTSGATIYLLASSAVRGGRPELGAEEADVGAAVEAAVGAAVCVCERVAVTSPGA